MAAQMALPGGPSYNPLSLLPCDTIVIPLWFGLGWGIFFWGGVITFLYFWLVTNSHPSGCPASAPQHHLQRQGSSILLWELKKGWRRRRRGVQGEASRQRRGQEKTSVGRRKGRKGDLSFSCSSVGLLEMKAPGLDTCCPSTWPDKQQGFQKKHKRSWGVWMPSLRPGTTSSHPPCFHLDASPATSCSLR